MMRDILGGQAFETPSALGVRRRWLWAIVLAFAIVAIYATLVGCIDNTNLGTTNGLWKMPAVAAREHATGERYLDSGGYLYFSTYGYLARLIPDKLMQYGSAPPVLTYRKMAMLDAIFGGLASGIVFLLAARFTGSAPAAAAVALVHAGAAFIMLNSLNSEDIISGYTLFLGAAFFFFEFLHSGKMPLLALSSGLCAYAILLHWTLMVPALAGFGAVSGAIMLKNWRRAAVGSLWLLLFLCWIWLLMKVFLPVEHIPFTSVLYPGKVNIGGWVGFQREKLIYLAIGLGNYFSGGYNIATYPVAFRAPILGSMIASWLFLVVGLGGCATALLARKATFALKLLALFGVSVFVTGEIGDAYAQPQDPQFQVQPMIAGVVGIIALCCIAGGLARRVRRTGIVFLAAVAIANGVRNGHLFYGSAGGDAFAIRAIEEQDRLFPVGRAVIVCQGFEGWTTWQFILTAHGDLNALLGRTLFMAREFTQRRGLTGRAAAAIFRGEIDGAFAKGRRVVASALWTEEPEAFAPSLATVTNMEQAREFATLLRASYRTGRVWKTMLGSFVEILPTAPGGETAPKE